MSRPKEVQEYISRIARMGGKALANSLTPAQRQGRARKAGLASAANMSKKQRSERARLGGLALAASRKSNNGG